MRAARILLCGAMLALPGVARCGAAILYQQTSLAGTTGTTPGLFDQLGLTGGPDPRRDFYEIFTNNTGHDVDVTNATLYGSVDKVSRAVLAPVVLGTVNTIPNVLLPDTDPSHELVSATLPVTNVDKPGLIEITFSPPAHMPAGSQLAFGVVAPLTATADVTVFGTDTLPFGLSSTSPPYFKSYYSSNSSGQVVAAIGNHYLVIRSPSAGGRATTIPALSAWSAMLLLAGLAAVAVRMLRA